MARAVIIHLSVEVPDEDPRSANEIADAVEIVLANGAEENPVQGLEMSVPLAEEL